MSVRKRQRREKDIAEEHAKNVRLSADEAVLSSKANDDLFVIDRSGSKTAKKRIAKDEIAKIEARSSLSESTLISKIISGKVLSLQKKKIIDGKISQLEDLWENSEEDNPSKSIQRPTKKLKVALPGQSYNPSVGDHQDVLAEALALQMQKDEKDAKNKGSFVAASIETVAESDDDNSDDELCADGDTGNSLNQDSIISTSRRIKQKVKLTKAQRNKQRTRKANMFLESLQKREKGLMKSLDNIPSIIKEISAEESEREIRALLREARAQESQDTSAMTYAEAGAIPLSDELHGSLRCLLPKGSNLYDQVNKMRAVGDLMDIHRRKRTAYEKPHGGKRIKWVAKYKYS